MISDDRFSASTLCPRLPHDGRDLPDWQLRGKCLVTRVILRRNCVATMAALAGSNALPVEVAIPSQKQSRNGKLIDATLSGASRRMVYTRCRQARRDRAAGTRQVSLFIWTTACGRLTSGVLAGSDTIGQPTRQIGYYAN